MPNSLSADNLAGAIQAATTDQNMKQRAEALGQAIRAEKGLDQAVSIVQEYLGAAA